MYSIEAIDVNEALWKGLLYLMTNGEMESSRAGNVLVAPGPVCTTYVQPRSRVLMSKTRDANPFFHFMEALWMLSGRYEMKFPLYFNSAYGQFSDDGVGMWDGYGWRWRQFFGYDQLPPIIAELKSNPGSRRCVLAMWNAYANNDWPHPVVHGTEPLATPLEWEYTEDFHIATHGGKAVPCNTHAYFDCRGGVLNMTVCNRSNDIVWGCYGANAVHFSYLQEYMAAHIGVPVGVYRQFSNNYHIYTSRFNEDWMKTVARESWLAINAKKADGPSINSETFDENLKLFISISDGGDFNESKFGSLANDAFFADLAGPMFLAWKSHKDGDRSQAIHWVDCIAPLDWRTACGEWLMRRHNRVTATAEARAK